MSRRRAVRSIYSETVIIEEGSDTRREGGNNIVDGTGREK